MKGSVYSADVSWTPLIKDAGPYCGCPWSYLNITFVEGKRREAVDGQDAELTVGGTRLQAESHERAQMP